MNRGRNMGGEAIPPQQADSESWESFVVRYQKHLTQSPARNVKMFFFWFFSIPNTIRLSEATVIEKKMI